MHKGRAIAFVVLTGALAVAALWRPQGPSVCMSKNLLNVSCPGCGMTRSVTSTAHGDFKAAFKFHAFGPFILGVGAIAWILLAAGLVTNKNLLPDLNSRGVTFGIVGWLVLLILYWIVRLILHATP